MCLMKSNDITKHTWSPLPELHIERDLCQECGKAFDSKTQQLQSQIVARFHTRFIDWENTERTRQQMERQQQTLPHV